MVLTTEKLNMKQLLLLNIYMIPCSILYTNVIYTLSKIIYFYMQHDTFQSTRVPTLS